MNMVELPQPIACNLNAFDAAQRERYGTVVDSLRAAVWERREREDGWDFLFPSDAGTCALAMEFATLERLCCPFWTFRLELSPGNGPLTLSLTGPAGAKELSAGFLIRE